LVTSTNRYPPLSALFGEGKVEIFKERFCVVTSDLHPDSKPVLADLTDYLRLRFPKVFAAPVRPYYLPIGQNGFSERDDDEVIRMAKSAINAAKFIAVAEGRYLEVNPAWSQSEAEECFLAMLVPYTNGDVNQLDRLLRSSIYYRPKWNKQSYRNATINKALMTVTARFDKPARKESDFETFKRKYRKMTTHGR
jgi:primase-polymerase (primpol)-like protein